MNAWLSPLRQASIALACILLLDGCSSYQHITPPPPRITDDPWKVNIMMTVPRMPGELPQVFPNLGVYARLGDHTLGLGTTFGAFLPVRLTYAYYHPLDDSLYLQGTLHVNQIFQGVVVPDPNVEATVGIIAQSGKVNHGFHVGMGYLNEPAGEGGFRWNPFSGAARSTFVPTLRYQALHGEATVGITYRPGITRAYHRMLATPVSGNDTLLFIPAGEVVRLDTLGIDSAGQWTGMLPDVAHSDYVFRLRDGRNVRISDNYLAPEPLQPFPPFAGLFRGSDMARGSNYWHSKTIDYYWIITDSGDIRHVDSLTLLDRRGLLLEPKPIISHYIFTGELLVIPDRQIRRTLEEASIPFWNDMVISIGYRGFDREEKE